MLPFAVPGRSVLSKGTKPRAEETFLFFSEKDLTTGEIVLLYYTYSTTIQKYSCGPSLQKTRRDGNGMAVSQ